RGLLDDDEGQDSDTQLDTQHKLANDTQLDTQLDTQHKLANEGQHRKRHRRNDSDMQLANEGQHRKRHRRNDTQHIYPIDEDGEEVIGIIEPKLVDPILDIIEAYVRKNKALPRGEVIGERTIYLDDGTRVSLQIDIGGGF
ncbi:MAG: hypothetical protein DRG30_09940, partial [Epsilonproteobacteria bacterium]